MAEEFLFTSVVMKEDDLVGCAVRTGFEVGGHSA